MNILVIGNGAREHALAWKISQSPKLEKLFIAPGNAGTTAIAQNLAIASEDVHGITAAALKNKIDLVMVGPEAPLTEGLVDALKHAGIAAFGPQMSRR